MKQRKLGNLDPADINDEIILIGDALKGIVAFSEINFEDGRDHDDVLLSLPEMIADRYQRLSIALLAERPLIHAVG